jgi:hypothetical protein
MFKGCACESGDKVNNGKTNKKTNIGHRGETIPAGGLDGSGR